MFLGRTGHRAKDFESLALRSSHIIDVSASQLHQLKRRHRDEENRDLLPQVDGSIYRCEAKDLSVKMFMNLFEKPSIPLVSYLASTLFEA